MSPPVQERVLSTLYDDGSRNWIRPKLSRGRFLRRRQLVGYTLIALFVGLPFIQIGGRPAFLIDLVSRELYLCGAVFRPSDTMLLMLLGLLIALAIFLVTALFGRVWCGWGCPQTVYLEHVFRPIERWLEGSPAQQRTLDATRLHPRRLLKYAIYAVLSFVIANVFLAYFVGIDRLRLWVFESPMDHVGGFSLVAGVSALMLFDFAYFREQLCIVACPYGRLQSVLLDPQSLIVGYDPRRGEPRGRIRKRLPVIGQGDCVDCSACVTTCPTGIDIRDGLQMECIGCAQCIDACDSVMDKLVRKRGLIGYTSQDQLAGGKRRVLRSRTIVYPVLLVIVGVLLAIGTTTRSVAQVSVLRTSGPSFVALPDGRIASQLRIKIENDSDAPRRYGFAIVGAPDATLRVAQPTWEVRARSAVEVPLFVELARTSLSRGERALQVRVADDAGFAQTVGVTLIGPEGPR